MAGLDTRRQRPPLPALFREAVTGLPLGEVKAAQTFLDLLVEALRSADASLEHVLKIRFQTSEVSSRRFFRPTWSQNLRFCG